jgi:hypothetical protein
VGTARRRIFMAKSREYAPNLLQISNNAIGKWPRVSAIKLHHAQFFILTNIA